MHTRSAKKNFLFVITIFIFLSCKKEKGESVDKYLVDANQGIAVASKMMSDMKSEGANAQGLQIQKQFTADSEVRSLNAIKDKNGINAFYIINFKKGGFSIVSAEKRTQPIFAFSETSSFNVDRMNPALSEWILSVIEKVEIIREKNIEYTGQDKVDIFSRLKTDKEVGQRKPPVDTSCHDFYEQVLPVLTTTWAQWRGYNNSYGALAVTDVACDGRAYAGCVPVAVGQIMNYHQFPTTFNYSIMPNNIDYHNPYTTAANEVSNMLFDIAENMDADYKLNVTEVTQSKVVPSLIADYGFTNATKTSFNSTTVASELRLGRPVILLGGRDAGFGSIPRYRNGHAWVCDGFYRFMICHEDGSVGLEYGYYHMNWGYNGDNNGYFGYGAFNPGTNTFNYEVNMISGLHP